MSAHGCMSRNALSPKTDRRHARVSTAIRPHYVTRRTKDGKGGGRKMTRARPETPGELTLQEECSRWSYMTSPLMIYLNFFKDFPNFKD